MVWSHPHDAAFYLAVAALLAGLLLVAFRFLALQKARSAALLALSRSGAGRFDLDPAQPDAGRARAGDRSAAVGDFSGRPIPEHESRDTEPVASCRADDSPRRGVGAGGPAPGDPKVRVRARSGRSRRPEGVRSASGDQTRLGWALEQLPARFEETLPFGVFVFSDGRSTEQEALGATTRVYRELGVPIHVIPLGDETISGDVAVQDIDAPREARPGTRVTVRVTLASRGYKRERTELRIRQDERGKTDVLASLPVTLVEGEQTHELVIDTDRAMGPLAVEVEELAGEAIAANNIVPFRITPRTAKLRVIYMEGSPLPEYRYIHEALEEDPNIEVVSMTTDNMHAAASQAVPVRGP